MRVERKGVFVFVRLTVDGGSESRDFAYVWACYAPTGISWRDAWCVAFVQLWRSVLTGL